MLNQQFRQPWAYARSILHNSRSDNESLSIWNGSFAIISLNIVNGYVAMYLLDSLHATDSEMGLLNSLPSLVNLVAMLAAAVAIGRAQSKKLFCAASTSISRSIFVLIAVLPWLPVHNVALWVVWMVALIRVPQSFGDLSWQALIGDLIPAKRRSDFFSRRNQVTAVVGLLTTFVTGLLLQQWDKQMRTPYQIAFLCTVFFAAIEIWFLIKHKENPSLKEPSVPLLVKGIRRLNVDKLKAMAHDRSFVLVVSALLFFNLGWQLSWPLFNIYQISTAHAPALWLGLFNVANQLTQVLTFRWWGRMADKYGNGMMMAIAGVGMGLAPALTIGSTHMWYLFAVNLVTGVPLAGTTLLTFNHLLEVCPEKERTTYIAYYNVALSVIGFVAPELGIWLLGHVGMTMGMMTSSGLRVLGGGVFWWTSHVIRKRSNWSASSGVTL